VLETLHLQTSKNSCPKITEGKQSALAKHYISLKQVNNFSCLYRYAIYELEYPADAGRIESKILFIMYAPDICDSTEKFLYATSKDALRKKVQPFNKELQVNDWADLDDESFLKVLKH
jgi:hypothetical protein